uniref:Uncharacterized protein n=1 Tax=Nelumbo nucifera TaxID=4432 RepID=A0A822ZVJ3_NELNU|nr:TPA_asm: hypothetical protein HUJ06_017488 [Nelumbo nucifera]
MRSRLDYGKPQFWISENQDSRMGVRVYSCPKRSRPQ